MHLPVGTLLNGGKYEIIRYISSGGFGCTYEARNTAFRNRTVTVAIKEFFVKDFCNRDAATNRVVVGTNSREALVEKLKLKFRDEAEALYALNHPNIVHVTDLFEDNNTDYYVMDYIEGGSLSGLISQKGRLDENEALGYILQIAEALKYVHSRNCLHLDVKPQNIMIDNSGKAILIDFGVSKQYDEANGENTSTLMGSTPGYAPIEQNGSCMTKFYPASDIYALGATLYKALTGITPPPASLIAGGERELDPLPSTVSEAVRNAIDAAMQLNRSKRPQSVEEFLRLVESGEMKDESGEMKDESGEMKDATSIFGNASSDRSSAASQNVMPLGSQKASVAKDESGEMKDERAKSKDATSLSMGTGQNAASAAEEEQDIVTEVVEKPSVAPKPAENPNRPKEKRSGKGLWKVILLLLVICGTLGGFMLFGGGGNVNPNANNTAVEFATRTFRVKGVEFTMVAVEGGTFSMGSNDGDSDEKPVHRVTLDSYFIGETEVTQALWQAVMGSNPSYFKGTSNPVEKVSYNDCIDFINQLNTLLEDQLPQGRKFRLPTEAEWEYAACGGNKSKGYKYSGSNRISTVAWYNGNSGSKTHPVKQKACNELGLYDMTGNVYEWCSDWYGDYSSSPQNNPKGPGGGSYRVLRGGSWNGDEQGCRSAYRGSNGPGDRGSFGLRLAL